MKKILIAFCPEVTPWHVITFAIKLAKENSAAIHAVYLSEKKDHINSDYPFPNDLSMAEDFSSSENISQENNKLIEDNIQAFKKECELNQISFSIEKNINIEQLIDKTASSQLLIIDSETDDVESILSKIRCPAFITSTDEMPQKIVLMYEKSSSANPAIETYTTLLPEFTNLPTKFLSIKQIEKGNKKKGLQNFPDPLSGQVLVVVGAFGKRALSAFFNSSFGKFALKTKDISLFITHDNKF